MRAARRGVIGAFATLGLSFGTFAARVPALQAHAHLSTGSLGIALLGLAVGSIPALTAGGALSAHIGSRTTLRIGLVIECTGLGLGSLGRDLTTEFFLLMVFGVGTGLVDVSMNTQAALIEGRLGRPAMSGFHGSYSLFTLVGAGLAAPFAGSPVEVHLPVVAALLLVLGLVSTRPLLTGDHDPGGRRIAWPGRPLAAACLVCFCALLAEGISNDWSAVYVKRWLHAPGWLAALTYAAFAATMALGRLTGDRLALRIGRLRLLRYSGLLGTVGIAAGLGSGTRAGALVGFACLGAGLATAVPIVFSAAAATPGIPAGPAIAAVSTTGYFAFLAGPPLIGALAAGVGLRSALLLLPTMAAVVALLGPLAARTHAAQP